MKVTLYDDTARNGARNERPALAAVLRSILATLNAFACRCRPIFSWMGGNRNATETNDIPQIRRMWLTGSIGTPAITGKALTVAIADAAAVPRTGLLLNQADHDQIFQPRIPQTGNVRESNDTDPELYYPAFASTTTLFVGQAARHLSDYDPGTATAREIRVQIAEPGNFGPRIPSGVIWERGIERSEDTAGTIHPIPGTEIMPTDPYVTGGEIIGETSEARDLRAIRDTMNRLWRDKRIHFGGGICYDGPTTPFGVRFTLTSGYRYFNNTAYGEGGVIPVSLTGPGINVPMRYTAQGTRTRVRVYVRIYAAMTGGSGVGTLAVYNRDDAGGMTGPTALNNNVAVSGTTFGWYPATTAFNPATDPYFEANANPAYDYDHILLCAKSSGASDLLIVAWTMCVRPETV